MATNIPGRPSSAPPTIKRGDRVIYWLIAERCLCPNNDHPMPPALEPPAEPELVQKVRRELADQGEFDDDDTLAELHPKAHAALVEHRARWNEMIDGYERQWLDKHPMHDHLTLKANAARELAAIEALADHEIVALHEPSRDERARVVAMSDDEIAAAFADAVDETASINEPSVLRERRLALIAKHARDTAIGRLPTDGIHTSPCGHLRTITGYPATVTGRVLDADPQTGARIVYYQLVVDFPETITGKTPTREIGIASRQGHAIFADGRRPQSGEFTVRS